MIDFDHAHTPQMLEACTLHLQERGLEAGGGCATGIKGSFGKASYLQYNEASGPEQQTVLQLKSKVCRAPKRVELEVSFDELAHIVGRL